MQDVDARGIARGRTHVVYTGLACITDDHVDLRSVLAEHGLGEPGRRRVEEQR